MEVYTNTAASTLRAMRGITSVESRPALAQTMAYIRVTDDDRQALCGNLISKEVE